VIVFVGDDDSILVIYSHPGGTIEVSPEQAPSAFCIANLNTIIPQVRNDESSEAILHSANWPLELPELRTVAAKCFATSLRVAALNPVIIVVRNEQAPLAVNEYSNRCVKRPVLGCSDAADEFYFDLGLGECGRTPQKAQSECRNGSRYKRGWFLRHGTFLLISYCRKSRTPIAHFIQVMSAPVFLFFLGRKLIEKGPDKTVSGPFTSHRASLLEKFMTVHHQVKKQST
jgi:hypothetical protein